MQSPPNPPQLLRLVRGELGPLGADEKNAAARRDASLTSTTERATTV